MRKRGLHLAAMYRILKKSGAQRVSESATKELAKTLEEISLKIATEALIHAMRDGRKTIKAEDVKLAAKKP